ncbi:MAG: 4-alpha-glucanotransferase [Planctomycetia bacterium]|nr:4-alpha-glucanotransferase [Planctomycetia bacterium]
MSLNQRSSGILLPISSLPGTPFVGALGKNARLFADFLAESGQHFWQLLPINPIDHYHSPYSSRSAFAGEVLYIDLDELYEENLLDLEDIEMSPDHLREKVEKAASNSDILNKNGKLFNCSQSEFLGKRTNYEAAFLIREPLWRKAFERFQDGQSGMKYRQAQNEFRQQNKFWLDDFAVYETLSRHFGTNQWTRWDSEYLHSNSCAVKKYIEQNQNEIEFYRFLQLVFDVQWQEFREYCHSKNLELLGDVPIYVGHASADTWSHPELFQLDENGEMTRVAGVPADDFNPDGQRWNSPLYNWQKHQETGFDWFVQRLKTTLNRFDDIRLDHFIGYYNYYSFPNKEKESETSQDNLTKKSKQANSEIQKKERTEKKNQNQTNIPIDSTNRRVYEDGWLPGPQEKLFDVLFQHFPTSSFLAEDLGVLNEGVHQLRNHYGLPGMFVLQFVFDEHQPQEGDPSQYWSENFVACTGTHDTPPILAWLAALEKKGPNPQNAWTTFDYVWTTLRKYQKENEKKKPDFKLHPEWFGEEYNGWRYSASEKKNDIQFEVNLNCNKLTSNVRCSSSENLPEERSEISTGSNISELQQTTGIPQESQPFRDDIESLRKASIRLVMNSRCKIALFPVQDILGLGESARMNFPGYATGNWLFRLQSSQLTSKVQRELKQLTIEGNRLLCGKQN